MSEDVAVERVDVKLEDLMVKTPLFDVDVKNPFKYSIRELQTSIPLSIPLKVDLTQIVTVDLKLLDYDIDKSIYLISPDLLKPGSIGFDDLLTTTPFVREDLLKITSHVVEELRKRIKESKLKEVGVKPYRIESKLSTIFIKTIPDELRNKYSIKLRIRRKLAPEVKDLIESRLTKEFKLTRLVKRMEIIRDNELLNELEKIMNSFAKKLKHS